MNRFPATIAAVSLLASPAAASEYTSGSSSAGEVPVVFDALLMRPMGLMMTAVGFCAWLISTPVMAITKPTDMEKTFKTLVANPARFTWVDPIGHHPDRTGAERRGEVL